MRKIMRMVCFALLITASPAYAFEHINAHVPDAQKVGETRLRVMFWDVYDAALFAPSGKWDEQKPFALALSYLRDLKGHKIADRSVVEIRKQGFADEVKLADWHAQMKRIFPDVNKETTLTGVYTASGETLFFNGNLQIGQIKDPDFGKHFFDIWLGAKTSEPHLREQLLGRP